MYTGTVKDLDNKAMDLLVAADRYDLRGLGYVCFEALMASLSVENALDLLVLADMHHCEDLKIAAKKLIIEKSGEVVEQEGWFEKMTKFQDLLKEVVKAIGKK